MEYVVAVIPILPVQELLAQVLEPAPLESKYPGR